MVVLLPRYEGNHQFFVCSYLFYGGSELIAITVSEADDLNVRFLKQSKASWEESFPLHYSFIFAFDYFSWNTLAGTNVSPFVMVFEK